MSSLIQSITLIRGDSSDTHEFNIPSYPDLSSTDWVGTYTIRTKNVSGAIEKQGLLAKKDDTSAFIFYIDPALSETLPVGTLHLSIELKNNALPSPFRKEVVQCKLTVKTSGVSN